MSTEPSQKSGEAASFELRKAAAVWALSIGHRRALEDGLAAAALESPDPSAVVREAAALAQMIRREKRARDVYNRLARRQYKEAQG